MEQQGFSISEAADILGIHRNTIRKLVHGGELKAARVGADFRISRAELARYWSQAGGGNLFDQPGNQPSNRMTDDPEFDQVCKDQGEPPETIIKNLMADYVKKAREAKEATRKEERERLGPKMPEILKMRKKGRKVQMENEE